MAKKFTITGIATGQTIEAAQVSQSVQAFTGAEAYQIDVSGSITLTGSFEQQLGDGASISRVKLPQVANSTASADAPYTLPGAYGFVAIDSSGYLYSASAAAGSQGASGAQGTNGVLGSQGAIGTQGNIGGSGTQGAVGTNGGDGSQGTAGSAGTQGGSGAQGESGPVGPQGADGANGNNGSQGAIGSNGDKGEKGEVGATGAGTQGTIGNTGAQGNIGSTGPAGSQGAIGAGTQGTIGTTGTQGETGGTGPTGTGTQGTVGGTGTQGEIGEKGQKGELGNTGPTGTGTQGAIGAGTQGAIGTQGNIGTTGTGTQGAIGTTGPTGPDGGTGPTGPTGTQGTIGTVGNNGPQGTTGTGTQGADGTKGAEGSGGASGDVYNMQQRYLVNSSGTYQLYATSTANSFAMSYTRSATTLTITKAAHGLSNGEKVKLYNIGQPSLTTYAVANAAANTFEVTVADTGSTTGDGQFQSLFTAVVTETAGDVTAIQFVAPSALSGSCQLTAMSLYANDQQSSIGITVPAGLQEGVGGYSDKEEINPVSVDAVAASGTGNSGALTTAASYKLGANFNLITVTGVENFTPILLSVRF